ncbi:lipopolysaccharide biosynthesis protein [Microbulbifer sp. ALW1]|uniref:lipopolysaccharide biosynthesis protein n=1 Tax=Microbulbifer sp. (strain ALW1) TaxID=1516059 RepID=UPI00135CF53B|nr:lipopolysaccharide biosynthesis protein [Microbulbifer sp. ALW1]
MSIPSWAIEGENADGHRVAKSAVITMASGAARLVASIVSAVVLGRLLTPDDFGLVAMVAPLIAFVTIFSDSGISNYTLQRKTIEEEELNHAFWLGAISATFIFGLLILLSPAVAFFYDEERISTIVQVLAATVLLTIFNNQHNALVKRCFRQDYYAIAEIAGAGFSLLVGILLALRGAEYWALVSIPLTRHLAHATVIWKLTGWVPKRPKLKVKLSKTILTFGFFVIFSQTINVISKNIDKVLLGWAYGTQEVGFYNMAYSIMMLPFLQVMTPVAGAVIPYYSQLNHSGRALTEPLCNVTVGLGIIVIPIMLWASYWAQPLITIVLGDQWLPSANIFSILALASITTALGLCISWCLLATGQPEKLAKLASLSLAANIIACFIGLRWGGIGIAIAQFAVSTFMFFIIVFYVSKFVNFAKIDFFKTTAKILLCSSLSLALTAGVHEASRDTDIYTLVASLIQMIVIFLILFRLLFGKGKSLEIVSFIKNTRRGNSL